MASYTKTMMELARAWLEANPDPTSDAVILPGKEGGKPRQPGAPSVQPSLKVLQAYPALAKELEGAQADLLRLSKERDVASADLAEAEAQLEQLINSGIACQHTKHMVDTHMHTDLSRWFVAWARHGYNVFDLSPDFVSAMLLTDARDIDIADVRLPFGGLLILVPDGFAKGVEGTSYTKIHVCEVSSAMLAQLEVREDLIHMCRSMPKASLNRVLDKVQANINQGAGILPPKSLLGQPLAINIGGQGTSLHIYATDGVRALDTFIERDGLTWDSFDELPDSVTEDADRDARHTLRRVVFGTLAYVYAVSSAMERRPVNNNKRKRAQPNDAQATLWNIGRTIKLDPQLVRSARSGSRDVAFRIKHRHIVRGHYRNQAVGNGRKERKRIFIHPFWKGPESGAQLVHTYKVDGQKTDLG